MHCGKGDDAGYYNVFVITALIDMNFGTNPGVALKISGGMR